jgi:thymidylate synthase
MAGWLGCEVGTYIHWGDSLHLYENDLRQAYAAPRVNVPLNTDSLALPKPESDVCWTELNGRVNELIAPELPEEKLESYSIVEGYPKGIQNILFIVGADSARRRHYESLAIALAERCSNPLLKLLWDRWSARKSKPSQTLKTASSLN